MLSELHMAAVGQLLADLAPSSLDPWIFLWHRFHSDSQAVTAIFPGEVGVRGTG